MNRSLRCVDALSVIYLVSTGALLLLGWGDAAVYRIGALLHFSMAVGIVGLSVTASLPPLLRQFRQVYPILLLLLLYGEVDLFVKLLHDPPGYDALVRNWDALLFGGHPHVFLRQWLPGRVWAELMHFFYVSYYGLLIGSFFYVWSQRPNQFPRFAFVVTGMFASFMVIFMAFPVVGPLIEPDTSIMTNGLFPQIVAWIYVPLQMNGISTGAFPSSHVGMSVGIACLLGPRRWHTRIALWGLVLGIAVSTAYGHFHYAIDAVTGGLTGGMLYALWNWGYVLIERGQVEGADDESARPVVESAPEPLPSQE
jgi:membrane-associated phospholipid phosphatase